MKPCGACGRSLPKESFSKKQWQSKKRRRCKHCIANDREAVYEAKLEIASLSSGKCGETATNDAPPDLRSSDLLMPGRSNGYKVEVWTDEDLFREPPPRDDCPICFIRMPLQESEIMYKSCCGKTICTGCVLASDQQSPGKRSSCPFCRTPEPLTDQENNERLMKRAKDNDPIAMLNLGSFYHSGLAGFPRDHGKALELWLRAGELGSAASYSNIGTAYQEGEGVKANMEKAKHYYALAAIRGCADGRFNLGTMELLRGDADRAVKHYMISAGSGDGPSVAEIRKLYARGRVSKKDFENALRAWGEDRAETKNNKRDAAVADSCFMRSFTGG